MQLVTTETTEKHGVNVTFTRGTATAFPEKYPPGPDERELWKLIERFYQLSKQTIPMTGSLTLTWSGGHRR